MLTNWHHWLTWCENRYDSIHDWHKYMYTWLDCFMVDLYTCTVSTWNVLFLWVSSIYFLPCVCGIEQLKYWVQYLFSCFVNYRTLTFYKIVKILNFCEMCTHLDTKYDDNEDLARLHLQSWQQSGTFSILRNLLLTARWCTGNCEHNSGSSVELGHYLCWLCWDLTLKTLNFYLLISGPPTWPTSYSILYISGSQR